MATIKMCTDIPQSKVLAEFLPLESADMYWKNGISNKYIQCFTPFVSDEYRSDVDYDYDVPCWSLAALINIIPKHFKYYNVLMIDISEDEFTIRYDEVAYRVNNDLPDITKDNPVDACYELILKLHESNLL